MGTLRDTAGNPILGTDGQPLQDTGGAEATYALTAESGEYTLSGMDATLTVGAFGDQNALDYKRPMYLVHFDNETTDYGNYAPVSPSNTVKLYLEEISGLDQKVTPEEGRASIGGLMIRLVDVNNEITTLLATDTAAQFQGRKVTLKVGYVGMSEASMLTFVPGWVTDISLSSAGSVYEFRVEDPQKKLLRKIFRGSEDSTVTIQGNPINILLAVLTSTGAGTNGSYDWYEEANGVGLDDARVNVAALEALRDTYYWAYTHYMKFTITGRERAIDWIQREICKPLNLYPVTDADGRLNFVRLTPPLPTVAEVYELTTENIIGLPGWEANFPETYNEVEFHVDHGESGFGTIYYYLDATSISNRGAGEKALVIKSKGLHTSISGSSLPNQTARVVSNRKDTIFGRFAQPPTRLKCKCFFDRLLIEAGDAVPVTHPQVPDIEAGTRGISARLMEVINRKIDWRQGVVSLELMDTGFARGRFAAITPTGTVSSGSSATVFTLASGEGALFEIGWLVDVLNPYFHKVGTGLTIANIDGDTITLSSGIGATPAAGWMMEFAAYGSCAAAQQAFGFISDGSGEVGSSEDGHLIVA